MKRNKNVFIIVKHLKNLFMIIAAFKKRFLKKRKTDTRNKWEMMF